MNDWYNFEEYTLSLLYKPNNVKVFPDDDEEGE